MISEVASSFRLKLYMPFLYRTFYIPRISDVPSLADCHIESSDYWYPLFLDSVHRFVLFIRQLHFKVWLLLRSQVKATLLDSLDRASLYL
jgi:hypothetical protein